MKKSQLLTVMGLLTVAGIAMVSAGFMSLSQQPDYTVAQAWTEMWDQHAIFAWVTTIYCSMMVLFDLWVVVGILSQRPEKTLA
jgi:membrane-bound ClpP family serine protease